MLTAPDERIVVCDQHGTPRAEVTVHPLGFPGASVAITISVDPAGAGLVNVDARQETAA